MRIEPSAELRRTIQTQRGRKTQKLGGTLQRFWASHRIGPPRCDTRPPMARQPKGEYASVPDAVVDHRPPVSQKPLTTYALRLLELYYKLNVFVMATEEKAPIEWAAEHTARLGADPRHLLIGGAGPGGTPLREASPSVVTPAGRVSLAAAAPPTSSGLGRKPERSWRGLPAPHHHRRRRSCRRAR